MIKRLFLIFAVFLVPLMMRAATASDLAATISSFTGGGSGSLTATASGNTVTVTGSLTDVTTTLSLDIDAGVTVVWQAEISTISSFTYFTLIQLDGSGTFDVTTGGSVTTTSDYSNLISGDSGTIRVSGTGTVQGGTCNAIYTSGNVEVSGGEVSVTAGTAISAFGENSTVTISGGTVSGGYGIMINNVNNTGLNVIVSGTGKIQSGDGYSAIETHGGSIEINGGEVTATNQSAIDVQGENSTVTVNGGIVSATTGTAISVRGNVEVNGGEVSATSGRAVFAPDASSITVSGGTISATTGVAICTWNQNSTIIVSGTGKVQATSDNGMAIDAPCNVEVKDNAQVSATTGKAIHVFDENPKTVTVSGGTVSALTGTAIAAYKNSTVIISSTGKVQATDNGGKAINTSGNAEVNGGEVTATTGIAIETWGEGSSVIVSDGEVSVTTGVAIAAWNENSIVTVSGGIVTATDVAIHADGENSIVNVSGTGKVQATGDEGIAINTKGSVVVSGGEISAKGNTINGYGENSTATVTGGEISTTNGIAINFYGENSTATVSGTSKVQATGDEGKAISARRDVEIKGGIISSTKGNYAIHAWGEGSTVRVEGGVVFAYGDAVTGWGNVIVSGFTEATGSGVVIAWNQAAGNTTYTQGSSVDISQSPESATVQWDIDGENYGISYVNGSNTGFIPLDVTVEPASLSVSPTSLVFAASGEEKTFTITTNTSWTVSSSNPEITVSPASGSGDGTITVTVSENTATTERTAIITVSATGVDEQTINVTQEATPIIPTLSVSPTSLNFTSSGEETTFTVTSNTDWWVDISDSWITVSPTSGSGDGTVTVTVEANPDTTERTATIIVSGAGVDDQIINVTQDAAPIIPTLSVSPTSLNVAASGEEITFSVESNTDWWVDISDSWITVSPTSGSGDGTVTVTVEANLATTERNATIIVSGTGVADQAISVTQEAAEEIPSVIPEETKPVGEDGKGTIELSLSITSNVTLTGSFEIQFPDGITLDEELTALSLELSGNFFLSFTYKGNNTWLIEIKSNALRCSATPEYQKIIDIAYIVADDVPKGIYEAIIMNLDFLLSNGISIKEDLITVPINVERNATSIENIGKTSLYAYNVNNMLRIESSQTELITIYSTTGVRLYSTKKNAGMIEIPLASIPGSVFIIKGSISGTIKLLK